MGFAADAAGDQDATVHTRSIHELSVLKVTSVGRTPYCGFVYDFTIPGDETFWAEGILVHNCVPCSQVNGRFLGTTEQIETVWLSYPEGAYGGYVLCQGGPACRGTVFGVWREGAA